jgi:DNA (cytosine-5)-methyltransferase 1
MPDVNTESRAIIDLFAGCGGMSLGFELGGYFPVIANERDAWACETYAANHPGTVAVSQDIRDLRDPISLVRESCGDKVHIEGIVGGPPCQGFSLSGNRDPKDPRNSLFVDFLRFVDQIRPKFFVMENVPGIRSLRLKSGQSAERVIVETAQDVGYNVAVLPLNAADYGVPQSRNRVFFVGIRSDVPFVPSRLLPIVTHRGARQVTVWQAISDLPEIHAGGDGVGQPYRCPASNEFQAWAREGSIGVTNHTAMRHTKRLVDRFAVIEAGQSVDDVPVEHAQRRRGSPSEISGKSFGQNNMRVFADRPSPTVPASFQSNFIHPLLHRNFTAREGARLQSFPDRYEFRGRRTTMSWEKNLSQYQQIGNAVPPLLAKAVATAISAYLADPPSREDSVQESGCLFSFAK